jgi:hypothetical protein
MSFFSRHRVTMWSTSDRVSTAANDILNVFKEWASIKLVFPGPRYHGRRLATGRKCKESLIATGKPARFENRDAALCYPSLKVFSLFTNFGDLGSGNRIPRVKPVPRGVERMPSSEIFFPLSGLLRRGSGHALFGALVACFAALGIVRLML